MLSKINESDNVIIFGGTGFIGRYLIRLLANSKAKIRIVTRDVMKSSIQELLLYGLPGQISFLSMPKKEQEFLYILKHATKVVNLIGIISEYKNKNFQEAHIDIPKKIAKACDKLQIQCFVHVSAMLNKNIQTKYAISKRKGEQNVSLEMPTANIVRLNIVLGSGSHLIKLIQNISKYFISIPVFGCKTKFQPIHVKDVALAIFTILQRNMKGKTFELYGDKIMKFREINQLILRSSCAIERKIICMPIFFGKTIAVLMRFIMPHLHKDQIEMLKYDIVSNDLESKNNISDLGIKVLQITEETLH